MSGIAAASASLVLVAVLGTALAGCDRAAPPAAVSSPSAAGPRAAELDPGEIKSAAQYLTEPAFADADYARGEVLALACLACHTLPAGQPHNIGPNLHGVFGRRAAALPGFPYSPALKATGLVWTPLALEAWLADPARFVEGTTMAFTGYRDPKDRRDLIAYLLRATQ